MSPDSVPWVGAQTAVPREYDDDRLDFFSHPWNVNRY